jgi:hypothetical protein
MPTPPDDELLRTAFRDVHATRLYGFALLVALGDRPRAAAAAGQALAAGTQHIHELRHPERAAAWLRRRVLRSLRRGIARKRAHPTREALRPLGVDEPLLACLSGLSIVERAALVASSVEHLAPADIETILGAGPAATRRMVAAARARYLAAAAKGAGAAIGSGQLTEQVLMVAARGFAPSAARTGRSA